MELIELIEMSLGSSQLSGTFETGLKSTKRKVTELCGSYIGESEKRDFPIAFNFLANLRKNQC